MSVLYYTVDNQKYSRDNQLTIIQYGQMTLLKAKECEHCIRIFRTF